ncbi:MAG: molybdate ABC transporter substrate-binding protein [Candidatus Firestonebacteria bacterium RIFOXYC2_FULL_39_67]|nr:MAG: molybdate ABC transporter substrate-binding protein [Candidatus Firestonebacteria bacterium RIFOXYD2_FULL_39_29]OGF56072.1 MAG: molybdate ABC transporter substrate-binding protein [Candidatus Firestonebacteria bacterium RIFOXYC2_FULL_39_67]
MRKVITFLFIFFFSGVLYSADLIVYCGAGTRPPMEEIAAAYTKENNTKIKYNFGGSAQMLAQIELSGKGDVFIPGEELYIEIAKKKKLISGEPLIIAYWMPVILVQKGNPKNIRNLSDLEGEGIKLGVGDERVCAIGIVTKSVLEKNKLFEKIEKNIIVKTSTANELGNAVKLKTVDAVIVWDSIAYMYPDSGDVVDIPVKENEISKIPAAVLKNSLNKEEAEKFIIFLKSEKGREIFNKHHYKTSAVK